MPTLKGTARVNGQPTSGIAVKLYKRSRFTTDPVYDTPEPSGGPDGTAISGESFGGAGAWWATVPTLEDYWEANEYNGHIAWELHPQDLTIDPTSADIQPVGATSSAGTGTMAPADNHVHEGVHQIAVNGGAPQKGDVSISAVASVVAGTAIGVDATDPHNPIIANNGVRSVVAGTNIAVNTTDPRNPVISSTAGGGGTTQVQHNDTVVAAEAAIDFEDSSSVTWTTVDDSANGRVKVTAASSSAGAVGSGPVQDAAVVNANATSRTLTLGSAPTAGNILVLMLATETTTATATLSQTGVTWSQAVAVTTNGRAELWIGTVGSGASATLTVNLSATSYGSAVLSEWSGLQGVVDTSATLSHAGTNLTWSPVIVPATDTLVVALIGASGFSAGSSSSNNYPRGRFDTFPSVIVNNGSALCCGWCWPGRRPIWMWGGTSSGNAFDGITAAIR
jgi:hypothetical protein